MTGYAAPLAELRFALAEYAGLADIADLPGCAAADAQTVDAVLDQAALFAAQILAPLNAPGDRAGSRLENGAVRTPDGFAAAYRAFVEAGWPGIGFAERWGGQALPHAVAAAVQEMWHAANMAWALCPLLTAGAAELLAIHGSAAQQDSVLPRLVSGEWTGTMNLTEPQAGSDLGAVRSRAVPTEDGQYRIFGQKIFISWGDHDLAPNIIHLVLARLPDAPAGSKGLSLFLVPKFLIGPDGAPGAANDIRIVGLEHKLGIHASPTCVIAFGDDGGALGSLVGAPHAGLGVMFTMMNDARLNVGLEGVAIAERATQQARDFARERIQGRAAGSTAMAAEPIIAHPDIRRMLLLMRSQTEAARALTLFAAGLLDRARHLPDAAARAAAQALADLLTPVVKAWCTDRAVEIASLGLQVHGGVGYVEETGAAQHLRDARITPIYEGTNGIQAQDLVSRKLKRDQGAALHELCGQIAASIAVLRGSDAADLRQVGEGLAASLAALRRASDGLLAMADPALVAAGSTAYLQLLGNVLGGWLLGRGALRAAGDQQTAFLRARRGLALFYAQQILPQSAALADAVAAGAAVLEYDIAQF